ncbi:MAG: cellulase family glycosylhydrolase [Corynebacteriales bacterium]|nr:cellulase family glycosylhydrolase [Mycobacteriales bacterium]
MVSVVTRGRIAVALGVMLLMGTFAAPIHDSLASSRPPPPLGDSAMEPETTGREPDAQKPPTLGVQFHATWSMYYRSDSSTTPNEMYYRHLDALARNGVSLLRVDVGWSTSQPNPELPTAERWYNKRIQTLLQEASNRNMRVLLTVHQSPEWSRAGGGGVKQFPDDPNSIAPWLRWMAEQYGDQVAAWEIWNEPNLTEFTGIEDDTEAARRYTALLKVSATALRSVLPEVKVIYGGPSQSDDDFIEETYKNGAKDYFDVLAVHPYQDDQTVEPEKSDRGKPGRVMHFPEVLEVMAKYGDENKPVWWTEFGYSVHANTGGEESWRKGVPTNEVSADYYRRTFELARKYWPQVQVAVMYTAYSPENGGPHQHGYRILEADGTVLPQLREMESYMSLNKSGRTW